MQDKKYFTKDEMIRRLDEKAEIIATELRNELKEKGKLKKEYLSSSSYV